MAVQPATTLEVLDLRHFSSQELRPLLEQESRLWARQLSWDYSSSSEMILRYVDARILPGYAAVEGGRIRGYSFFVYEQNKGVIGDLFVAGRNSASGSGHALEEKLLVHTIETLQQSPGIHRVEAQLLIHETDSVARPFLREGFQRYRRLFMMLPLAGRDKSELINIPVPAGIEIRKWTEQDFQPAAAIIAAAYGGHVDSEINDQYRSVAGSMRFLNNIVRFPGCGAFDADASFVAIHSAARTMVGLILCSRVKSDVGHVTQVCVMPEFRAQRLGASLVTTAAAALRRRNFAALSLTVTEANTRAVELYRQLDFSVKRIFDAFVWEG
jgi:ribosomal protein S18 acetylase RimI-like enzyme